MQVDLTPAVPGNLFTTSGPQVVFELTDNGQAHVMITVALSDGTVVQFPDGTGRVTRQSTTLPRGRLGCSVAVFATNHDANFGDTYDSEVRINGTLVATARGTLATPPGAEQAMRPFILEIA